MSLVNSTDMLQAIVPFRQAGFALHWLRARSKAPVSEGGWSEAPVASIHDLRATYQPGYNIGVRLGEPSKIAGGYYLYVLDLDIRIADLADEAWEAFARLFPDISPLELPCVVSGSGGESRHLYFLSDKPLYGSKLAVSEGKHRRHDKRVGRDVWSYDWEIELFGTGKQVAMPPSIHPETSKPYYWLREFDFDALLLGMGPVIPAAVIEALGVAETSTYEFETREPLTFEPGQMERDLSLLPDGRLDDYHDWITLGQALHHQFGGSDAGFNIWVEQSKRSSKFDNDLKTMLRKWRGFGKNRRKPVTMATIRTWAQEGRIAALKEAFDEEDDYDDGDDEDDDALSDAIDPLSGGNQPKSNDSLTRPVGGAELDPFDSIFGGNTPVQGGAAPAGQPTSDDPLDNLLNDSSKPSSGRDWVSELHVTEEGDIKSTLHNIKTIIANDAWTRGVPAFNEFTQEIVQRGLPGRKQARRKNAAKEVLQLEGSIWRLADVTNGDLWTDDKDDGIRAVLEAPKTQGGYAIKVSDRDLGSAVNLVAHCNCFHPVREYLEGLEWDGQPRVERLFVDYLGAEDNAYHRIVAKLTLIAGVVRVFEPGHKFDFAPILEGLQGKRKSTFISILAKNWFAELDCDFEDAKQMVEKMQGAWILEIPELSGFARADVRNIKASISRRVDKVRLAYARRARDYPRQCIFIGSTNDERYLKDDTGGRRFWPVKCEVGEIDTDRLASQVDQVWAETYAMYRSMRENQPYGTLPLFLMDADAQAFAGRIQESRRVETQEDAIAGQIASWLDRPVLTGGFDDLDDEGQPRYRNRTCLVQIWVECLGRDRVQYNQAAAQMVGRAMSQIPTWKHEGYYDDFKPYGRQRLYERGGSKGRLERAAMATHS